MGYTALFKVLIPGLISGSMIDNHLEENDLDENEKLSKITSFMAQTVSKLRAKITRPSKKAQHPILKADDEDYEDYYNYERGGEWWKEQGFSDLTTAWTEVTGFHNGLWSWFVFLFALFMWQGWFKTWIAFYIEHIISNFNWVVYFFAANSILTSALTQNDLWSWISFVGYSFAAFGFFKAEYNYGTDAIRYLNNDYYKDPVLLPSVLYLIGLVEHKVTDEPTYDSDESQIEDIPID